MTDRRETSRFFLGVDLGQASDPTAIAMVRRVQFECRDGSRWREDKRPIFQVGHLERVALHTPYPAIVGHVDQLMKHRACAGNIDLAIDQTGVGGPVADMFRQAGIDFVGVVITGGQEETSPSSSLAHVPKLKLISHLQALLHDGRLRIQKDLPEAPILVGELQNFRMRFSENGRLTFNAREGKHDDLVLALAIAVWRAMRSHGGPEGWLEYYRRLNEQEGLSSSKPKGFRFKVPGDITTLCLIDGSVMQVPPDRIVEVGPDDAGAYGRRGWERLPSPSSHEPVDTQLPQSRVSEG
jgi:hypothetical protein